MLDMQKFTTGDILSHSDIVSFELFNVQQGMNFRSGRDGVSIFLMSTRSNSPYDDQLLENGRVILYEGHDVSRRYVQDDPKGYDQPTHLPSGRLTTNGKFCASIDAGITEIVRVYEKMQPGIWVFNGTFKITSYKYVESGGRRVIKFTLEIIEEQLPNSSLATVPDEHNRVIPSHVKQIVYKRDRGVCALCGSNTNLHYDHDLPYSKGGVSFLPENIRLLCAKCNLRKSNKIE